MSACQSSHKLSTSMKESYTFCLEVVACFSSSNSGDQENSFKEPDIANCAVPSHRLNSRSLFGCSFNCPFKGEGLKHQWRNHTDGGQTDHYHITHYKGLGPPSLCVSSWEECMPFSSLFPLLHSESYKGIGR